MSPEHPATNGVVVVAAEAAAAADVVVADADVDAEENGNDDSAARSNSNSSSKKTKTGTGKRSAPKKKDKGAVVVGNKSSRVAGLILPIPVLRAQLKRSIPKMQRKSTAVVAFAAIIQAIASDVIAHAVANADFNASKDAKRISIQTSDISKAISKIPSLANALQGRTLFGAGHRVNYADIFEQTRAGTSVAQAKELAKRVVKGAAVAAAEKQKQKKQKTTA